MRCLVLLTFISFSAFGQLRLPKLVSNGVVLQRDQPLKLWGWAAPNDKLTLVFQNKKFNTQANTEGEWKATLPAFQAGGPFTMKIFTKNEEILIEDILIGDVWLGSGQSNMVIPMERVKEKYAEEIKNAHYPFIRNFFVKTSTDLNQPQKDFSEGKWLSATPQNVLSFGAVTYFFAKEIYDKYNVPIGIINSSVGGTPIQAWISEEGLKQFADIQTVILRNKETDYVKEQIELSKANSISFPNNDKGLIEKPNWQEEAYTPNGWSKFSVPGYWEDQGLADLNGVVWFRKEIEVPKSMLGKDVKLFLGRIVDSDVVYVNGTRVGNITYQYPPRRYTIPASILKEGKNTLVVRIQNEQGKGGFVPDKRYELTDGITTIDLEGKWIYKIGQVFEQNTTNFVGFSTQNQPTALFNAMISPIVHQTAIKGVVWYQGESNVNNPEKYDEYLTALINDYRRLWGNQNLPILGVQLANFMEQRFTPTESNWAVLRNKQRLALTKPNTAMTVAIDTGEWNDIHPLDKKTLGFRLALAARNLVYNEKDVAYSGPQIASYSIQSNKIILHFTHLYDGLKSANGEPLTYFSVAGEDKKFLWATAHIVGNTVEVFSDKITHPRYVRYAWADNPFGANLTNSTGIPASPFEVGEQ